MIKQKLLPKKGMEFNGLGKNELQTDFVFLKGKKGKTVNLGKEDFSKFTSYTREKGFTKSIVKQGDTLVESPALKFKSEILGFKGPRGEGKISKIKILDNLDTGTKGVPEEYVLNIARGKEKMPVSDTIIDLTKKGKKKSVVDSLDVSVSPKQVSKGKDLTLLPEFADSGTFNAPKVSDAVLGNILDRVGQTTKGNIANVVQGGGGTKLLFKEASKQGGGTQLASKSINLNLSSQKGGTVLMQKTKQGTKTETKQDFGLGSKQRVSGVQIVSPNIKQGLGFGVGAKTRQESLMDQSMGKSKQDFSRIASRSAQMQDFGRAQGIAVGQGTKQGLGVGQAQAFGQITPVRQRTITRQRTALQPRTMPPIIPNIPGFNIFQPERGASKKTGFGLIPGFRALVKRKGKYVPVSGVLPESQARYLGALAVLGKSARSFKLELTNTLVQEAPRKEFGFAKYFRPSKREKGVFVEKTRYAINTPGELGEITYKGIEASRGRNLFGKTKRGVF
jgi:hypothetical protein